MPILHAVYRKTAKQIADTIKPMHERPNEAFSQIRHVPERTNPAPVPNEQIKQRINLESSAKPCFINLKSPFLIDVICSSISAFVSRLL